MVGNLHLLQDSSSIVSHGDVSVGRDEDLVEASWAERRLDNVGDSAGGEDMGLDGFVAKLALLLALTVRG